MASKKTNTLQLLQQHVSDLNAQKDEVNRTKSELTQQKDMAMCDVTEKCESLTKSIIKSKTSAIRQLNEFYEKQEKVLNEFLANLQTRIAKAEEELIIDLNGIPVPAVESLSYDFDVTKARISINHLQLGPSVTTQSPIGVTKGYISESGSVAKTTTTTSAHVDVSKQLDLPTPKKPKLIEGQPREHVRDYINCCRCNKPRCIYREYFLSDEEKLALSKLKVSASYVCGGDLPRNTPLAKTLIVESQIDCESTVNWHYFHPKLRNHLVCYKCGSSGVRPMNEEEKLVYRVLHKVCVSCQRKGKQPRCQRKTRLQPATTKAMSEQQALLEKESFVESCLKAAC